MGRTININGRTLELPPYALGDRVLHHGVGSAPRPATIVGINLLGAVPQRLRIWLDARGTAFNGFTCSVSDVEPMSAVDRLGELA